MVSCEIYEQKTVAEVNRKRKFAINDSSKNFINSYVVEKHVVEEALKERHLTGQSARAVISWIL